MMVMMIVAVMPLMAMMMMIYCNIYYEHSEEARAPHTNGPRDVPRCGELSLLQKSLHYRAMYLRRVGIDGRSYAAAPTQVSAVATPPAPAA